MSTYAIVHDIPGRMRVRYGHYAFSEDCALAINEIVSRWQEVTHASANAITGSLLLEYQSDKKEALLTHLQNFDIDAIDLKTHKHYIESHHYSVLLKENQLHYRNKIIKIILKRYAIKWFLPTLVGNAISIIHAIKFFKEGLASLKALRIDVPVLDATSIFVSFLTKDFNTAGNIMMLLNISEELEDYTKKSSNLQLEESLSLNIDKVWISLNDQEVQIPMVDLQKGDVVIVATGAMIPVDGEVVKGEGMVNEASFTGEPLSKHVGVHDSVFAGTVVEEGRIYVKVRALAKHSRISNILNMINTNESLKANVQAHAEHLADAIVPFSFLGFFGMLAYTRSLVRASGILMVDYSCAIKLTTSIAIISAMQEASTHAILVKGGKYLEAMANADTIVFDKTGTLTNATPKVLKVTPLNGYTRNEVLKTAACLEEHFPHSIANAIVKQALKEGLDHKEEHAKVEYIIAHGISTSLHDQKCIIGSHHFVFEDEKIPHDEAVDQTIHALHEEGANSLIYLAIGGQLAGIIAISDPLKDNACEVISALRQVGFKHIVMMTGDSYHAAKKIADDLALDDFYAGVLPEDKAEKVKELQAQGHQVVMVGDGVNDTPALSQADVSISLQNASDVARELADITLTASDLMEIVTLKRLSMACMTMIHRRYGRIVTFNTSLIILNALGILTPGTSATLHNLSTFLFSAQSTQKLLKNKEFA